MVATITPTRRNQADLLRAAELALHCGLDLAAGMTVRAVLESHTSYLCTAHNCSPGAKRPSLATYVERLFMQRHITKSDHRQLRWVIDICNRAAHNDGVSWDEIVFAINAAKEFVELYPLPPWYAKLFPAAG